MKAKMTSIAARDKMIELSLDVRAQKLLSSLLIEGEEGNSARLRLIEHLDRVGIHPSQVRLTSEGARIQNALSESIDDLERMVAEQLDEIEQLKQKIKKLEKGTSTPTKPAESQNSLVEQINNGTLSDKDITNKYSALNKAPRASQDVQEAARIILKNKRRDRQHLMVLLNLPWAEANRIKKDVEKEEIEALIGDADVAEPDSKRPMMLGELMLVARTLNPDEKPEKTLADACSVKTSTVHGWKKKNVPAKRALHLRRLYRETSATAEPDRL